MIRRGVASGCSWWPAYNGWQWSAHGPFGHRAGFALSERAAQVRAQAAMSQLSRRQDVEAVARG